MNTGTQSAASTPSSTTRTFKFRDYHLVQGAVQEILYKLQVQGYKLGELSVPQGSQYTIYTDNGKWVGAIETHNGPDKAQISVQLSTSLKARLAAEILIDPILETWGAEMANDLTRQHEH